MAIITTVVFGAFAALLVTIFVITREPATAQPPGESVTAADSCEEWWTDHASDGVGIEPYESHVEFVARCRAQTDELREDAGDYLNR